ncbi:RNA polymerase sigma factor [Streptococcus castoreus]|uniref:RNA polymerase sigma factor n=1 Tax=Streptococcus castoreus TaxID=254786 RepID=UPI0003F5C5F6|nr:RNA polymerase sigma factor [Streptococcus castoreus]
MELIKLEPYEEELIAYSKEIIAYLVTSGVPRQTACDISQDVFLKMLESDIILPPRKMRAWMYRVAVRKYIDQYRRDKTYLQILQREFFHQEKVIEFDHPNYTPLYEAINHLPDKYRMVLTLYYFHDLSVKEMASILHKSISSVKVNLMRGRALLKGKLKKAGYTYEDFNGF